MAITYETHNTAPVPFPNLDEEVSRIRGAARAGSSWLVLSQDAQNDALQVAHGRFVLNELILASTHLLESLK